MSGGAEVRCRGRLFHRLAAKTGKADGSEVEVSAYRLMRVCSCRRVVRRLS